MARKVQISKEVILQAALELLIESGYSAINIKTLSQKIGCSTQPLVWHFENMNELRKALADYALCYANRRMEPTGDSETDPFEQVGKAYVKMALYEPHLFQFLYLNDSKCYPAGDADMLVEEKDNAELIKMISGKYQITELAASQYFQDTLIYTHGIAAFVATGMMKLSEGEMMAMINRAGDNFLMQAGVSPDRISRQR